MKHQKCKYGVKCKYFHPRKLIQNKDANVGHKSGQNNSQQILNDKKPTYAKLVAKNSKPQNDVQQPEAFLGQAYPSNQIYVGQQNQIQRPFLGQGHIQPFSSPLNTQNQLLEIKSVVMGLSQKLMALEKNSLQMHI